VYTYHSANAVKVVHHVMLPVLTPKIVTLGTLSMSWGNIDNLSKYPQSQQLSETKYSRVVSQKSTSKIIILLQIER